MSPLHGVVEDNMNIRNIKKGFILVYTVLIITALLVIMGIVVDAVFNESRITQDEAETLKAFYAANTGLECARYWHLEAQAFDTSTMEKTYECGDVGSFVGGKQILINPAKPLVMKLYSMDLEMAHMRKLMSLLYPKILFCQMAKLSESVALKLFQTVEIPTIQILMPLNELSGKKLFKSI
jgi:hypothetical protein